MVFYESVHRVRESVEDMTTILGADRPAVLGRELTKLHEQVAHGSLGELSQQLGDEGIVLKGEFVIVIAGAAPSGSSRIDIDRLLVELSDKLPGKEVAKVLARATGEKRNALYQRLLDLSKDNSG